METTMITGIQIRAAMGLLGWSVATLKKESGLGSTVLNEMKNFDGIKPNAGFSTLEKVRTAIVNGLVAERSSIAVRSKKKEDLEMFDAVAAPIMKIAMPDSGIHQAKTIKEEPKE